MLQKIKDYLSNNPNSTILSAVICSLTTMSGDELVAILGAFGLLLSTVWGLVQRTFKEYHQFKESKIQSDHEREIEKMNQVNAAERYKIETAKLALEIEHIKSPDLNTIS